MKTPMSFADFVHSWLLILNSQLKLKKGYELILAISPMLFVWNFREITAATHDKGANKILFALNLYHTRSYDPSKTGYSYVKQK